MKRSFLLAALFLTACAPSLQGAIDRNERRWLRQSVSDYQIEVTVVRSIWHAQTYRVTVADGQVTQASASCTPAPYEGGSCEVEPFSAEDFTVPGLFELARSEARAAKAEYVTLRFNEQFGFPEQVTFDDPRAVDDDTLWRVVRFEPQP